MWWPGFFVPPIRLPHSDSRPLFCTVRQLACCFVRPSVLCGWGRVLLSYLAQRRSTHVSVCADPPRANGVRPVQLSSLAEPCYGVRQPWLVRHPASPCGGSGVFVVYHRCGVTRNSPHVFSVGWEQKLVGAVRLGGLLWLLTVPFGAASAASWCGEVGGTTKVCGGVSSSCYARHSCLGSRCCRCCFLGGARLALYRLVTVRPAFFCRRSCVVKVVTVRGVRPAGSYGAAASKVAFSSHQITCCSFRRQQDDLDGDRRRHQHQ